ncbi:MAG: FeoA family protein [Bacteroidetes bacterium]|jgi:ferrous iron transport protein A|nr:FeoA family protein [Bacteroidota bacterium]MDA0943518.1 FeoA family protein [Bacteroidota bacterium]MDA1112141.1 FeoA family protein [Bacteroidota bacterium]
MPMTADQLRNGESAVIASLHEGDYRLRLAEMGCVPGTRIKREYQAPGGDPIAFRIDTYLLGLRLEEARLIEILPEDKGGNA